MGSRVIVKHDPSVRRNRETRVLAGIIACIALPVALGCFLAAVDMRVDLSGLWPQSGVAETDERLLGWPDLEPFARNGPAPFIGTQVRLIGYMMDDTEVSPAPQVSRFILMPEAGGFFHPAHRNPDEMVEVHTSQPCAFLFRKLVWSRGTLAWHKVRPYAGKAAWVLEGASVSDASPSDLRRFFGLRSLPTQ